MSSSATSSPSKVPVGGMIAAPVSRGRRKPGRGTPPPPSTLSQQPKFASVSPSRSEGASSGRRSASETGSTEEGSRKGSVSPPTVGRSDSGEVAGGDAPELYIKTSPQLHPSGDMAAPSSPTKGGWARADTQVYSEGAAPSAEVSSIIEGSAGATAESNASTAPEEEQLQSQQLLCEEAAGSSTKKEEPAGDNTTSLISNVSRSSSSGDVDRNEAPAETPARPSPVTGASASKAGRNVASKPFTPSGSQNNLSTSLLSASVGGGSSSFTNVAAPAPVVPPNEYAFHFIPFAAEGEVQSRIVKKLIPTKMDINYRRQMIRSVCEHVDWTLRQSGVLCDLKCYVFGSVHLRTCLPDGDNDITIVFDDGTDVSSPVVQMQHADYLPRVKEMLPSSIQVDQLVFAEVRVLKLVAHNYALDITVDQMGGTSTVCFLHEVDGLIGNHHLFKKSLLLLKAWCYYEARILGAQGGGIGTYALTVMLITVMNELLKKRMAMPSPFGIFLYWLQYYSLFDFERNAVTVHGPLPMESLHNSPLGGKSGVSSASSTRQQEVPSPTGSATSSSVHSSASPTAPPSNRYVSEEFIGRCIKKYMVQGQDPAAARTPPTMAAPTGAPRAGGDRESESPRPEVWPSTPTTNTFPVRYMNVVDPIRPQSNLCRGISYTNSYRIRSAITEGFNAFSRRMQDITEDAVGGVVDDYFANVLEAVDHVTPDDDSVFATEYRCPSCIHSSSPFCTDLETAQNPFITLRAEGPPVEGSLGATAGGATSTSSNPNPAASLPYGHQQQHQNPMQQGPGPGPGQPPSSSSSSSSPGIAAHPGFSRAPPPGGASVAEPMPTYASGSNQPHHRGGPLFPQQQQQQQQAPQPTSMPQLAAHFRNGSGGAGSSSPSPPPGTTQTSGPGMPSGMYGDRSFPAGFFGYRTKGMVAKSQKESAKVVADTANSDAGSTAGSGSGGGGFVTHSNLPVGGPGSQGGKAEGRGRNKKQQNEKNQPRGGDQQVAPGSSPFASHAPSYAASGASSANAGSRRGSGQQTGAPQQVESNTTSPGGSRRGSSAQQQQQQHQDPMSSSTTTGGKPSHPSRGKQPSQPPPPKMNSPHSYAQHFPPLGKDRDDDVMPPPVTHLVPPSDGFEGGAGGSTSSAGRNSLSNSSNQGEVNDTASVVSSSSGADPSSQSSGGGQKYQPPHKRGGPDPPHFGPSGGGPPPHQHYCANAVPSLARPPVVPPQHHKRQSQQPQQPIVRGPPQQPPAPFPQLHNAPGPGPGQGPPSMAAPPHPGGAGSGYEQMGGSSSAPQFPQPPTFPGGYGSGPPRAGPQLHNSHTGTGPPHVHINVSRATRRPSGTTTVVRHPEFPKDEWDNTPSNQ